MTVAACRGDPHAFRRALGRFPTGVCITTATVEGERIGMTMSSFNSLSLHPPLVLFGIGRNAASLPLWERARGVAINVLAENQASLSDRFARQGANKWEGVDFAPGLHDAPVLPGTAATFEGVRHAVHDGGDHRLFVIRVERFRHDPDRAPLVFAAGRYAALHPGAEAAPLWPLDIHY